VTSEVETTHTHLEYCLPAESFLYTLLGMTSDTYAISRRSERKPTRKAIVLMVESEDPEIQFDATTLDISEHGARIQTNTVLTPGQTLSLFQPDDPARSLRCTVVWAGEVSSDGHDQAGLEFLDGQPTMLEN
jgi:PilZ domain